MEAHIATIWEAIADAVADGVAVVHGGVARSWGVYEDRAARLAAAFSSAGLGPDSKIGLYLYNSSEYLEAQFAGFKMRGVPINVNYRYLDDELWHLLDNADAEAVVFHSSLGDRVDRVRSRLARLKLVVEVDDGGPHLDGAARYEDLLAAHGPQRRIRRSREDIYMLYTGGTTGMPKGVMYPMGSITQTFLVGGYGLLGLTPPSSVDDVPRTVKEAHAAGMVPRCIPCCPLMHGTGTWIGALMPHLAGGTVITLESRSLDAHEAWTTAAEQAASLLVIVGDAVAKPLLRALDEATSLGRPYDLSALRMVVSSGVMWSAEVKEALLERAGHLVLVDAIGSTEGSMGVQVTTKGSPVQTARFSQTPTTKVFTEDGREVVPGSGEAGLLAAGGNVPLGYYKDLSRSERTFRVVDGVRYSFPGDWATVEPDGTIKLLGRGSQCINTGGEKVFPEEVEEAIKTHPAVWDCLVVGMPDERFGEQVTAIVSLREPGGVAEEELIAHAKRRLAHYKAPRRVVVVTTIPRGPNAKADYTAAKQLLLSQDPSPRPAP